MRRLILTAAMAATLAGCTVLRTEAGRGAVAGLDAAASRPVIEAVERQAPEVAAAIVSAGNANASAGTSWPWLSAILDHWSEIAGVLALGSGGAAFVARGRRIKDLTSRHEYLKAASEALSLGVEIAQAKNVPLVEALKGAAKTKLGSGTIRDAMERGGAETVKI